MRAKHTTILTIFVLIAIGFVLGLTTLTGFFTLAAENVSETSFQDQNPNLISYLSFSETRDNNPTIPINWFWNIKWDDKEEDSDKWDTNLVYLDRETEHSNKPSLAHVNNSLGKYFAIKSRNIKVSDGKTYHIEFYAKTNATGENALPEVSWLLFDKDGNELEPYKTGQQGIEFNSTHTWEVNFCMLCGKGNTKVDMIDEENDWKLIAFEFTVPSKSNSDHIALLIDSLGEGYDWSWWYMTDFSIKEI